MMIIAKESAIHVNVFVVNGDSWRKIHVRNGNVRYDMLNANSLTDHALAKMSYAYFVP